MLRRPVLASGAVGVVTFALLANHRSGAAMWKTLWAEDGQLFLTCAQRNSFPSCANTVYAGYLQLGPRILAAITELFPIAQWARLMSGMALLVNALCLTVIFVTTRWMIPNAWFRAGLTFVIASSGTLHAEVAGNAANLHWLMFASALFVAVNPDAREQRGPAIGRGLWLVVVCLSEALAPGVLVAHLAGSVLRRTRSGRWRRDDLAVGIAVLLAAGTQFAVQLAHPRPIAAGEPVSVGDALSRYPDAVGRFAWHGYTAQSTTILRLAVLAVSVLLVVGAVVTALRPRRDRILPLVAAVALLAVSVGEFVVSVLVNHRVGDRYTGAPFVLLVVATGALVSALIRDPPPAARRVGALPALAASIVLVALLAIGPYPPRVAAGTVGWQSAVARAKASCRDDPAGTRTIVTAPRTAAGLWRVTVACADL